MTSPERDMNIGVGGGGVGGNLVN